MGEGGKALHGKRSRREVGSGFGRRKETSLYGQRASSLSARDSPSLL